MGVLVGYVRPPVFSITCAHCSVGIFTDAMLSSVALLIVKS